MSQLGFEQKIMRFLRSQGFDDAVIFCHEDGLFRAILSCGCVITGTTLSRVCTANWGSGHVAQFVL